MRIKRAEDALRRNEEEQRKLICELQKALGEIRTLKGLIPICSSCKKIRDDKGSWQQLEAYIMQHTDAELSHGLCSECAKKLYPETEVIVITGFATMETAKESFKKGVFDFIAKPFKLSEIQEVVTRAAAKIRSKV